MSGVVTQDTQVAEPVVETLHGFSQKHRSRLHLLGIPVSSDDDTDATEVLGRVEITARVFDRGPGSLWEDGSGFIASWLRHCGGTVNLDHPLTREGYQPGYACGCAASSAIYAMERASRIAGDEWLRVDLSQAISGESVRSQYEWLAKAGGRGDIEFSLDYFGNGNERPCTPAAGLQTYYLDSVEVGHLLALARNPRLHTQSHYSAELGNQATLSCPVTSRDDVQLKIARDIRKMSRKEPGVSTGVKFLISNTGTHLRRANHWFAVVYEIKRKEA